MSDFLASDWGEAEQPLAPWRDPLARALHRNRSRPYSRYAQLATVTPDGKPANRTVVFRGFGPGTNALMFITDRRSDKIVHLAHCPHGELCWYFTQSREQFRLSGPLHAVGTSAPEAAQAVRQQVWQQLSDNARGQFGWPPPQAPRQPSFEVQPMDRVHPPDTFVLLLLVPQRVDHLELRGEPQSRCLYHWGAGKWQRQEVNP